MTLKDEVVAEKETAALDATERQLLKVKAVSEERRKEVARLQRHSLAVETENDNLRAALDIVNSITAADPIVPKWAKPKAKNNKKHSATPVLMLSDLHLDEIVNPEEVQNINCYNREIAEMRLTKVVDNTVDVLKTYVSGLDFDGFVLALGGDIMTGNIHEELQITNHGTIMEGIVHWVPVIASAIEYIADEMDVPLWIPCVRGNHDRYSKKKPSKQSAQESFSWIIYHWLADHFRGDDRVEFAISPSADLSFPIYNTDFVLTHGDQFSGGGGIAGIYSPIMRGQYKKQQRNASLGTPFDCMIMGHFHQLIWGQKIIVNGSLKGYDEYAFDHNFEYEEAKQALWIVTPEHGITQQMPIFAESENEPWKKQKKAAVGRKR